MVEHKQLVFPGLSLGEEVAAHSLYSREATTVKGRGEIGVIAEGIGAAASRSALGDAEPEVLEPPEQS